MSIELLITNIGFTIAIIISLGIGIFVLTRDHKNQKNILFFLVNLFVALFEIAHVVGINITDPHLSQSIFMINAFSIFIGILSSHLLFAIIEKVDEKKNELVVIYTIGIIIFAIFMMFPSQFMEISKPIFYFPNYYNPGRLYFIGDIYFFSTLGYFFYNFIKYYRSADYTLKNRLKFFLIASVYGCIIGSSIEMPFYGIRIDPLVSAFFWIHTILLAYAVFKHDLVNMHLIARRALIYTMSVVGVSTFIVILNILNNIIITQVPNFPIFLWPIMAGIIIVFLGRFIWIKIRESDILKYEFITTVTHKFRTPMTYIKWSIEKLRLAKTDEEREKNIMRIETGNNLLIELTDILVETEESEAVNYNYEMKEFNLKDLVKEIIENSRKNSEDKGIEINFVSTSENPIIIGDKKKILFVIQVMINNALLYTEHGGKVNITLSEDKKDTILIIKDTGIGIPKEEVSMVFEKFYREERAKKIDTEGMGMSLFIAKRIIERHGGKIWVTSNGEDQGSSFYITFKKR